MSNGVAAIGDAIAQPCEPQGTGCFRHSHRAVCSYVYRAAPTSVVSAVSAADKRSCFSDVSLGDGGAYCFATVHRHYAMAVRPRMDMVSKIIRNTGSWEANIASPGALLKLAAHFSGRPVELHGGGGTFLDIGSNLGYFSLQFASAGWSVLAVEPMSHNRRAISLSMCVNPDVGARIRLISTALTSPASSDGGACILRSSDATNIGNGHLSCGAQAKPCTDGEHAVCEEVPLMTLDRLLDGTRPRLAAIDVVKMDVEGLECQVLEGASDLFTQYRPSLLVMEGKNSASRACAFATAARFNYTVHALKDRDHNLLWVRHHQT